MTKRLSALLLALALAAAPGTLVAGSIWDYSTTPASNNSAAPNGAPEGMSPSSVNDTMREHMARSKGAITAVTTAGTNTITATLAPAITAYVTGMEVTLLAGGTNTGAATLNLNGLGAKDLQKMTTSGLAALASGDIRAGQPLTANYDGTRFVLTSPVASAQTAPTTYAPTDATYVVVGNTGFLSQERALGTSTGIVITDNGANSNIAVAVDKASQADMEARTANKVVTADNAHQHPLVAKGWINFEGTTAAVNASHPSGMTVTRHAAGDYTVNFTVSYSTTSYACAGSASSAGAGASPTVVMVQAKGTNNVRINVSNAASAVDRTVDLVCFGDQ